MEPIDEQPTTQATIGITGQPQRVKPTAAASNLARFSFRPPKLERQHFGAHQINGGAIGGASGGGGSSGSGLGSGAGSGRRSPFPLLHVHPPTTPASQQFVIGTPHSATAGLLTPLSTPLAIKPSSAMCVDDIVSTGRSAVSDLHCL